MNPSEIIHQLLCQKDLDANTDLLAEALQCPLVVIVPSLAIVTYSRHFLLADSTWQNAVHRGYITLDFATSLNNWEQLCDPGHPERMTITAISSARRRFYRLFFDGSLVGYLNIAESRVRLDTLDPKLVQLARDFYARVLSKRSLARLANVSTREEEILDALLADEVVDRLQYLAIVQGTPLEADALRQIVCIDLHDHYSFNAGPDTFKEELKQLFPHCIAVIRSDILVIVFQPGKHQESTVLEKPIAAYLKKRNLTAGFSNTFHDLYQTRRYAHQARFALQYAAEKGPLKHYNTCQVLDLLTQVPRSRLRDFVSEEIFALKRSDEAAHTDYLQTLSTWIASGCSIKETAAAMHVHRNTVAYRLDRLRNEFHLNLDSPLVLPSYSLSCQILALLEQDGKTA
jgi:DNA-binding CsgD family transcriptional regulator